jgi:hypothetical protein
MKTTVAQFVTPLILWPEGAEKKPKNKRNQHGWSADEFLNPRAPEIEGLLAI